MRIIILFFSLFVAGCINTVERIENAQIEKTRQLFNVVTPEGNYSSRYRAIHNLPATKLCEAVLPLQVIDWIFIPMLEPVGVIRWNKKVYIQLESTENAEIGLSRLYKLLELETRNCQKTRGRPLISPSYEDRECGAQAVREVCGGDFVSEKNYERLLQLQKERKIYQKAVNNRIVRNLRPDNEIRCTGYTLGGYSSLKCN